MKLNQLILVGATSFLTSVISVAGYAAAVTVNLSSNAVSPTASLTISNTAVAQNRSVAITSGTFVAAEKPTSGTARIVTENGQRYLVLDSAFRTNDQGPDLHVLLDTAAKPPQAYRNYSSYVNLGKLQKFSGTQRYPIPAAIDVADFKSVVIWCRMANATFGYAPLGSGASSASAK